MKSQYKKFIDYGNTTDNSNDSGIRLHSICHLSYRPIFQGHKQQ